MKIFSIKNFNRKNFIEKIYIFCLFLGVSLSICYWAIAKCDVDSDFKACGEAQSYMKMSRMDYGNVEKPYRYRIFAPSLVYGLNKLLNLDSFLNKYL